MPPKKRNLTEAQTPQNGSRRRSTRLGSTGKKSSYFENQDDVDDSDEDGRPRKTMKPTVNASRAGYKLPADSNDDDDEDQYEDSSISDDKIEEEEDDEYESATPPPPPPKPSTAKRGRGRPRKDSGAQPKVGKAPAKKLSGGVARAGHANRNDEDGNEEDEVEDEDEDEDDGYPKTVFIPAPKLRDTNGIEYEDTRVHPNTLHFLGDLKANNLRSWLKCK